MKRIFLLFIFYWGTFHIIKAQNVGINSSGATPNASAGLDVDFSNKGVLIPRMTTAQRTAISSPANGLLVFDTQLNCVYMYLSTTSSWRAMCDSYGPYYTETTTLFNPGSSTLLKTQNVTTNAATNSVLIEAEFDYAKGTSNSFVALCLYRNGTEIHEVAKYSVANADNSIKLTWVDTPGAGTYTYTLRYYIGGGTMSTIYGSNIVASVLQ